MKNLISALDDGARQDIFPVGLSEERARAASYSFGVRTGRIVWIAGQIARDQSSAMVGLGDVEAQTVQVFENMKKVVEAAGGSLGDVVTTTTYITDASHRNIVNGVRARYFPGPNLPASTLIVVAALALPEYLVEIDAVAVLPRGAEGA